MTPFQARYINQKLDSIMQSQAGIRSIDDMLADELDGFIEQAQIALTEYMLSHELNGVAMAGEGA